MTSQPVEVIDLSEDPLSALYALGAGHDYRFLKMGKRDVFLCNAPDLIQWAFTHKSIGRGRFFKVFSRWLGNGILASEGEAHRAMRRTLLPTFNADAQKLYMQTVMQDAPTLLDEWQDGEVDLASLLFQFTYAASIRTIYGLDKLTNNDTNELLAVLATGSEAFLGRTHAPPAGHYLHEGRVRHPVVNEALDFMFANWKPTPLTKVLDTLDPQEKYDQTLTMLSASLDTSMAAIVWMFYLFSQHPKAFEKFCDDARRDSTHYAALALDETLRLYPTGGWLNTRESFSPLNIRGMDIPTGTNIFVSSWVTHRDTRYFSEPDSFIPERFSSPLAAWTYFPFGGGSHLCLGRPFSLVELPYLASLIVRKFDIEFLSNNIQLRLRIGLTPVGELYVNLKRR